MLNALESSATKRVLPVKEDHRQEPFEQHSVQVQLSLVIAIHHQ
jgi:hypothetical protein